MAYIGKTPVIGNFQKCDSIAVVNGQAAYTLQVGGTNVSPQSENHMLVSLNGILQAPVDSFTVSGSTLTFASNLVTGDVIDFVMILGNVLDLGVPSDNTVSLAKLTATGTKDATTFLRGDNTFAEAGGGKVLQVVNLSDNTSYTQSGTGTTDCTNYNISITPSSASSKVMIIMSIDHYVADSIGTSDAYARGEAYIRDVTNGTDLANLSDLGYYIGSGGSYEQTLFAIPSRTILHSPNTTSSITYSVRLSAPTSNNVSQSSDFIGILMEIGA
jgi:hypothetical protein